MFGCVSYRTLVPISVPNVCSHWPISNTCSLPPISERLFSYRTFVLVSNVCSRAGQTRTFVHRNRTIVRLFARRPAHRILKMVFIISTPGTSAASHIFDEWSFLDDERLFLHGEWV